MPRGVPLKVGNGDERAASEHVVEDCPDATDPKAENKALNVKAGGTREVEKARRIPVGGDEERLGQAEWHSKKTRPNHGLPIVRKCDKGGQPRHQERA